MKLPALLAALTLVAVAHADVPRVPIHISLRPTAIVLPDDGGFFSLAGVADMSGGDKAGREKLAAVRVGRAPQPGASRTLTVGDIRLKLRQAGFSPEKDAVIDGAKAVEVATPVDVAPSQSSAPAAKPAPAQKPLVHRGDSVTILIQDGDLQITARGIAREPGGVGDNVRVHRDGVPADLSAVVIDSRTVRLEM